jgi:hypothetical protein
MEQFGADTCVRVWECVASGAHFSLESMHTKADRWRMA